jgi:hypothetical protein
MRSRSSRTSQGTTGRDGVAKRRRGVSATTYPRLTDRSKPQRVPRFLLRRLSPGTAWPDAPPAEPADQLEAEEAVGGQLPRAVTTEIAERHVAFPGPAQVCAKTIHGAVVRGHLARFGRTPPTRAARLFGTSVDPTEARNSQDLRRRNLHRASSLTVVRSDGHRRRTGRFLWITPMVSPPRPDRDAGQRPAQEVETARAPVIWVKPSTNTRCGRRPVETLNDQSRSSARLSRRPF